MLVVNLFAGPGTGKSTTAASVFSNLKQQGYNCELVTEYAKDLTYDKAWLILKDQVLVFAEQNHRLRRLENAGIDIAICDSPLLLSLIYGKESTYFRSFAINEFSRYNNLNFFLVRNDAHWKEQGRTGSLRWAKSIDIQIKELLHAHEVVKVDDNTAQYIIQKIKEEVCRACPHDKIAYDDEYEHRSRNMHCTVCGEHGTREELKRWK